MSDYQLRQLQLTKKIEESFKQGKKLSTIVRPVADYKKDRRICFTAVVFLPKKLENKIIREVINPLKQINPTQYFYCPNSFHITIQNVKTSHYPALFTKNDIPKVEKVFKEIVPKYSRFTIKVKRLFELPTSLAISAFSSKEFAKLALELRRELIKVGVADNKKYADQEIVIGNVTISRFTKTPNNGFIEKVKELKETEIGEFQVKKISLIITNAVCHPLKTRLIREYPLKAN